MPVLEEDGWELESAVVRHLAAPDTFLIPEEPERRSLTAGQLIQLLFLLINEQKQIVCEKMWVTITDTSPDFYTGILESCPVSSDVLAPGDKIEFTQEHVSAVFIPENDPAELED